MADLRFTINLTNCQLFVVIMEVRMKTVSCDNEPWSSIEEAVRSSSITTLIVDLRHVEFMSSAILGKIVGLRRKFSGEIIIANLNPFLEEIFRVTGLSKILTLRTIAESDT